VLDKDGLCPECNMLLVKDNQSLMPASEDIRLKGLLNNKLYDEASFGDCISCNAKKTFVFTCPNNANHSVGCVRCIPNLSRLDEAFKCQICNSLICPEVDDEINGNESDEFVPTFQETKEILRISNGMPQLLSGEPEVGDCPVCFERRVLIPCSNEPCKMGCLLCLKQLKKVNEWVGEGYNKRLQECFKCPMCRADIMEAYNWLQRIKVDERSGFTKNN